MGRSTLVVLAALLVIGCSSATVSPSPAAPAVSFATPTPLPSPTLDPIVGRIRRAAGATIATGSVGFDATLTYHGNVAIRDGTRITERGGMSFGPRRQVVATADYSALSLGKMQLIIDDQKLYLSGSFLGSRVRTGQWLLVDLESSDPRAVPFLRVTRGQNDTSLVLWYLFGAVSPVAFVALEDVHEAVTERFQFAIDLETAPDLVPAGVRDHLLDAIAALRAAGIERTLDGQVWLGSDGLVHRVVYTYTLGRVLGGGRIEVAYTFRDFGKPVLVGIPSSRIVVRLEDLKT